VRQFTTHSCLHASLSPFLATNRGSDCGSVSLAENAHVRLSVHLVVGMCIEEPSKHTHRALFHTHRALFHTRRALFHTHRALFHTHRALLHTHLVHYSRICFVSPEPAIFRSLHLGCKRISTLGFQLTCLHVFNFQPVVVAWSFLSVSLQVYRCIAWRAGATVEG
jgi:hypothetical protein